MRKRNWLLTGAALLAFSATSAMALDDDYVAGFLGVCNDSPNRDATFGIVVESGEASVYACEDVVPRRTRAAVDDDFDPNPTVICDDCDNGTTGTHIITVTVTRTGQTPASNSVWMCNYTENNFAYTSITPNRINGGQLGRPINTGGSMTITITGEVAAEAADFSMYFSLSDTDPVDVMNGC